MAPIISYISSLRNNIRFRTPSLLRLSGVLLIFLMVCALASTVWQLFLTYNSERAATHLLESQVHQAQVERDQLAGRKQYQNSPAGRIGTATENGWVKAGDQAVNFSPHPSMPVTAPANATQEDETAGGLILAAMALFLIAFLTGIALLIYRWRAKRIPRPVDVLTPRSELKRRPIPGR